MEDLENKPKNDEEKTTPTEEGTGGDISMEEVQSDKPLFDRYGGVLVEIDENGTKYRIDPKTKERIEVLEYGDLSED